MYPHFLAGTAQTDTGAVLRLLLCVDVVVSGADSCVRQQLPGGVGAAQEQQRGGALCVQAVRAAATAAAELHKIACDVHVCVCGLSRLCLLAQRCGWACGVCGGEGDSIDFQQWRRNRHK